MKLKRVSVKGLNNKVDCDFEFHDDINIVTGINGCGKTTFLKMIWYAISGNIERLVSEIRFKSFNLESSSFSLSLIDKDSDTYPDIDWEYTKNEIKQNGNSYYDNFNQQDGLSLQSLILESRESSLFFPTFRRIEGGYSLINPKSQRPISKAFKSLADLKQDLREINNVNIQDGGSSGFKGISKTNEKGKLII